MCLLLRDSGIEFRVQVCHLPAFDDNLHFLSFYALLRRKKACILLYYTNLLLQSFTKKKRRLGSKQKDILFFKCWILPFYAFTYFLKTLPQYASQVEFTRFKENSYSCFLSLRLTYVRTTCEKNEYDEVKRKVRQPGM